MKKYFELHDAVIAGIDLLVGRIEVRFEHLSVFESKSVATIQGGRCFGYRAKIVVVNSLLQGAVEKFPLNVLDGSLILDGAKLDNVVPVKFKKCAQSVLEIEALNSVGDLIKLSIEGAELTVFLEEPPIFEEFAWNRAADRT